MSIRATSRRAGNRANRPGVGAVVGLLVAAAPLPAAAEAPATTPAISLGGPLGGASSTAEARAVASAPWAAAADPECFVAGMELEGRASPLDSATVELGGETAKLCYGAPSARGRTMIGGDAVPYGQPWRLGANEATALHLPFPARLGDVELEPGSYSLYAVPDDEEWTVVVNEDTQRWGIPIDAEVTAQDVGEIRVPRERPDEHVETLTFAFRELVPHVDEEEEAAERAELVMEWEEYRIALPLVRTDG